MLEKNKREQKKKIHQSSLHFIYYTINILLFFRSNNVHTTTLFKIT